MTQYKVVKQNERFWPLVREWFKWKLIEGNHYSDFEKAEQAVLRHQAFKQPGEVIKS